MHAIQSACGGFLLNVDQSEGNGAAAESCCRGLHMISAHAVHSQHAPCQNKTHTFSKEVQTHTVVTGGEDENIFTCRFDPSPGEKARQVRSLAPSA